MLTLLEHSVTNEGGTYAFCDTDSMAIVATQQGGTLIPCPGGSHRTPAGDDAIRALSWKQVDQIIEQFSRLNPYNPGLVPGSILQTEEENYDPDGRQQEVRCYAISSKRYRLATTDGNIIKCSQHGLGHLLNPAPGTKWIDDAWTWLTDPTTPEPDWLELPALSKITITSPDSLHWFAHLNRGKTYADQIKPWNFLLVAYPDPFNPTTSHPVAPYSPDPTTWTTLPWLDRHTGNPVTITTRPHDGHHQPATRVRTYRDILTAYQHHPETKALAPDHTPVTGTTRGLLQRRPIRALPTPTYIGKEANDLHQRSHGLATETDTQAIYTSNADTWSTLYVPALQTLTAATIADATGVNLRTIQRARAGTHTPRTADLERLTTYVVEHARNTTGAKRTDDPATIVYRYLARFADAAEIT